VILTSHQQAWFYLEASVFLSYVQAGALQGEVFAIGTPLPVKHPSLRYRTQNDSNVSVASGKGVFPVFLRLRTQNDSSRKGCNSLYVWTLTMSTRLPIGACVHVPFGSPSLPLGAGPRIGAMLLSQLRSSAMLP